MELAEYLNNILNSNLAPRLSSPPKNLFLGLQLLSDESDWLLFEATLAFKRAQCYWFLEIIFQERVRVLIENAARSRLNIFKIIFKIIFNCTE